MRGGAAGGLSASRAVFRVRQIGDLALLVLQWVLVLHGTYLMLVAVHLYALDSNWLQKLPTRKDVGETFYIRPSWQRLIEGISIGIMAIGLGGVLFYLRRLYVARRQ